MIEFIESPMYDNWFKNHIPEKKLLICSPYMKQTALDRILKLYDVENRCLDLEIQVLIRGDIKEFTYSKSTDFSVIETFLGMDSFDIDNFKRMTNLHMKAYLVDDKHLLVTSGNMTDSGMFVISGTENFEGGIATDEVSVIEKFKEYFSKIWVQGETLEIFYDELLSEYKAYLDTEYSDGEMVKQHIKRKKCRFSTKSKFAVDNGEVISVDIDYDVDKLLPVGYIKYLDETLKILYDNPRGLSYADLGDLLRSKIGLPPGKDKKTNDVKFGEEKGKYAVYFGLARLSGVAGKNTFFINSFGEMYLNLKESGKIKYLKDQLFSKSAICAILKQMDQVDNFNLSLFLQEQYGLKGTTLNRICNALKDLVKYIKEVDDENELTRLLDKLK